MEQDCWASWLATFPEENREEWQALLEEMEAQETREARLYKALDKLEAVISHNESDRDTWLPLEYDLQFTYPEKAVQFSPWLKELKKAVDQWTEAKIKTDRKKGLLHESTAPFNEITATADSAPH